MLPVGESTVIYLQMELQLGHTTLSQTLNLVLKVVLRDAPVRRVMAAEQVLEHKLEHKVELKPEHAIGTVDLDLLLLDLQIVGPLVLVGPLVHAEALADARVVQVVALGLKHLVVEQLTLSIQGMEIYKLSIVIIMEVIHLGI